MCYTLSMDKKRATEKTLDEKLREVLEKLKEAKAGIRESWNSKYSGLKELRNANKCIDETITILKDA